MNPERELTSDELYAVSGGTLPLPALMATIIQQIAGPADPGLVKAVNLIYGCMTAPPN
jgi:hypothetical protein